MFCSLRHFYVILILVQKIKELSYMGARNQVVELENRIVKLEQENLRLQEKVTFLTRKLYGRSTEGAVALTNENL